jgi:hypothetical protein
MLLDVNIAWCGYSAQCHREEPLHDKKLPRTLETSLSLICGTIHSPMGTILSLPSYYIILCTDKPPNLQNHEIVVGSVSSIVAQL